MQVTARSAGRFVVTLSILLLIVPPHLDGFSQETMLQQAFHRRYRGNINSFKVDVSWDGAAEAVSGGVFDEGNRVTLGPPKFFALAVSSSGQVFAGTYASGVIRSTDNGETKLWPV